MMTHMNDNNTASPFSDGKRYYSLNDYCKKTFGEKVYRLSLNGGMTCPNRDGKYSTTGCLFCSEGGSGDFAASANLSITEQIAQAKERICAKTNCRKFIAYFQAYTNTYAPVSYLRDIYIEAIRQPEVCAISIGTRSDCLGEDILSLLAELNRIKPVWVELGLQSIHNATLSAMNTHTTVEQFNQAVEHLSQHQIPVIAHLILGLPGESRKMILESVKHLAVLPVSGVKLQLLHVLKNTPLAKRYETSPFPIFSLEEYCDLVVDCVELLPPEMVIHRLTGDGPKKLLIAPLWSSDKKRVLNSLNQRFVARNSWQGKSIERGI